MLTDRVHDRRMIGGRHVERIHVAGGTSKQLDLGELEFGKQDVEDRGLVDQKIRRKVRSEIQSGLNDQGNA